MASLQFLRWCQKRIENKTGRFYSFDQLNAMTVGDVKDLLEAKVIQFDKFKEEKDAQQTEQT